MYMPLFAVQTPPINRNITHFQNKKIQKTFQKKKFLEINNDLYNSLATYSPASKKLPKKPPLLRGKIV